jgi:phenylalanyl-tRNA synthetase beta subunit
VRIFDLYNKKPIPEGKKSIGLSMIYASVDRTLKDTEADDAKQGLSLPCERFTQP